jgi:hypothetical protein
LRTAVRKLILSADEPTQLEDPVGTLDAFMAMNILAASWRQGPSDGSAWEK